MDVYWRISDVYSPEIQLSSFPSLDSNQSNNLLENSAVHLMNLRYLCWYVRIFLSYFSCNVIRSILSKAKGFKHVHEYSTTYVDILSSISLFSERCFQFFYWNIAWFVTDFWIIFPCFVPKFCRILDTDPKIDKDCRIVFYETMIYFLQIPIKKQCCSEMIDFMSILPISSERRFSAWLSYKKFAYILKIVLYKNFTIK